MTGPMWPGQRHGGVHPAGCLLALSHQTRRAGKSSGPAGRGGVSSLACDPAGGLVSRRTGPLDGLEAPDAARRDRLPHLGAGGFRPEPHPPSGPDGLHGQPSAAAAAGRLGPPQGPRGAAGLYRTHHRAAHGPLPADHRHPHGADPGRLGACEPAEPPHLGPSGGSGPAF